MGNSHMLIWFHVMLMNLNLCIITPCTVTLRDYTFFEAVWNFYFYIFGKWLEKLSVCHCRSRTNFNQSDQNSRGALPAEPAGKWAQNIFLIEKKPLVQFFLLLKTLQFWYNWCYSNKYATITVLRLYVTSLTEVSTPEATNNSLQNSFVCGSDKSNNWKPVKMDLWGHMISQI